MPLHIASQKQGVVWNGSFFVHHSLALVNREMTLALLDDSEFTSRFDLGVAPVESPAFGAEMDARFEKLTSRESALLDTRITVRHRWPPDFARPAQGKLVLCQPWEFGSLPRDWVSEIARSVDEVWAYTEFVRQTYIESGVPAEKVVVVPPGVNTGHFHPDVPPYDFSLNPLTRHLKPETFKFLFVGGTIARKGIDVLLDAYDRAFTASDEVMLIIKDFGANSFYAQQGAEMLIRALQAKPGGAKIVYLTEEMSEADIAGLYAACDCLVHPYRGEGYGLPIAEAMACGKPTIVTGMGAALDFATAENAYLIPATRQFLNQTQISGMEMIATPFWAEPDRDALRELLWQVVVNRAEAEARGAQAARDIAAGHTWSHSARIATDCLLRLSDRAESFAATSFQLPMGLTNFSLSASGDLPLLPTAPVPSMASYEERRQAALTAARNSDWPRAIEALQGCLRERPNDWDALNALAVAEFRSGQIESALARLQRGAQAAPDPRDFHHNLAFVLLETQQPIEALEHALTALKISPDSQDIRRTVERIRDAALQAARSILRHGSQRQRIQAKRAPAYRALMDAYRKAEEALEGNGVQDETASSAIENRKSKIENSTPQRPKLSLVMIVKNEERFLRNCLESAKDIVDEIVIVDTGSTDRTLEIARRYDAKIVETVWNDDFSAARNLSLDHATGDWALWLDADEEIAPGSQAAFREAIETAGPDVGGYMAQFRNWLQSTTRKEGAEMAIHHACRLFRLVPGTRFEGRIHEQNLRSLQALGYHYAQKPGLIIDHFGYAGEIMTLRDKHQRFIRMLTREVEECPDETFRHFHLFNLGNAYFTFGDMENAARYLEQAGEKPDIAEEFTATLFTEWATALHRLGRANEGLAVCERADKAGIVQAGVEFARGYCLLHLKRYLEAERAFRGAIQLGGENTAYARSGDTGIAGFKARYGLGLALMGQERHIEAMRSCEAALQEQETFIEARYLLALCLMRLQRDAEARSALETLLRFAPGHAEAQRDLGKLLFTAGEQAQALPYLRQAGMAAPEDYEIQARLAVCYEQTGQLAAARQTYERLRLLAPLSAEVRVNLGRVLAQSGEEGEALACFTEALGLDARCSAAYFNAGDILYRLGFYGRAAETYMAGLEVNPANSAGFFTLGNCYFHTEDYAAAELCYRQALTQDPHHSEARHNLQIILSRSETKDQAA